MPVPVNEREVKAKTAGSGVGFATTGGTFCTRLCSPSTGQFTVKIGLTSALNQPVPQISNTAQTMIQGTSEPQICAVVGAGPSSRAGGIVLAESSCRRNAGEVQI